MAAGQGFKTFTTGEVLTAADVNGYLMQGINVFASSAARSAAITSPQEGQYSFLKDTNALEYYDGAAWVGAPVGDITAVTAGKGLTGGGSSGDVTVALATTAKGDLVAGSGASTAAVLTVGNNGETLIADSTAATGLKWATPSGTVQLATGTLSGSSVAITSIPSTYHTLILQVTAFRGSVDTKMAVRFNNDANARYQRTSSNTDDNDNFPSSYFNATGTQDSAVNNSVLNMTLYNYANTSIWKLAENLALTNNQTTNTNLNFMREAAFYNQTTAISEINLIPEAGGNWSAGTYTLYGVK